MTGDSQVINITSCIFEALYVPFVTYLILKACLGDNILVREC